MAHARLQATRRRIGALLAAVALCLTAGALALPASAAAQTGATGTITGTVSGAGTGALEGVRVTAERADGGIIISSQPGDERDGALREPFAEGERGGLLPQADGAVAETFTGPSGTYSLSGLPPDLYVIRFDATVGNWASEYYNDQLQRTDAAQLEIAQTGGTIGNVDAQLAPGAVVSGTVSGPGGAPAPGVCVTATRAEGGLVPGQVLTGPAGTYSIDRLPQGTYTVDFDPCDVSDNLVHEWWDDATDFADADELELEAGEERPATDAQLATGGSISGTLLGSDGDPVGDARVQVYRNGGLVETRFTNEAGVYTVNQLAPGAHKVEFTPPVGSPDLPEFFDDEYSLADADEVMVAEGAETPGIDEQLMADITPPTITINEVAGPFNTPNPSFSFNTNDPSAQMTCAVTPAAQGAADPEDHEECSDALGHTVSTDLDDGDYIFSVIATDPAGNDAGDQIAFTVDRLPPEVSVTGGPQGPTADRAPTFTFAAEPGASVTCSIDTGIADYASCSSAAAHSPAGELEDGIYTFRVRAVDVAGNEGIAAREFTVDTTGPDASIESGPDGPTSGRTPVFGFEPGGDAVLIQCSMDDPLAYGDCTSEDSYVSAELDEGPHTFRLRVEDALGNPTVVSRSFTVDFTEPVVTIDAGPSGPTLDRQPTFGFTATEGTVECSLVSTQQAADFGPCSASGTHTPESTLPDGTYVFTVRATDAAGNEDSESREFSVDNSGPTLAVTGGPSGATNDATPRFEFDAGGDAAVVECAIDPEGASSASFGGCGGAGSFEGGPLPDGAYVFRVRAADSLGNETTRSRSFTVDTAAPAVSVTGGPSGTTQNAQPTFEFEAEGGATVECSVSAGAHSFGPCSDSGSHTVGVPLADGSYEFAVRVTDAAGNDAAATRQFTVDAVTEPPPPPPPAPPSGDTTPPTVKITSGPLGKISDRTPRFAFTSDDPGASFLCSVDGGAEEPCASPLTLRKLSNGAHTFAVTAVDAAGNRSAADTRSFKVKKKKRKKRR